SGTRPSLAPRTSSARCAAPFPRKRSSGQSASGWRRWCGPNTRTTIHALVAAATCSRRKCSRSSRKRRERSTSRCSRVTPPASTATKGSATWRPDCSESASSESCDLVSPTSLDGRGARGGSVLDVSLLLPTILLGVALVLAAFGIALLVCRLAVDFVLACLVFRVLL